MSAVLDKISSLLRENNVYAFSSIGLKDCRITKKYLLDRAGISADEGVAVMMAVPYMAEDSVIGNISEYAKSKDYHLFFSELFDKVLSPLRAEFTQYKFEGFSDHSPIDERDAAARAGLGIIGSNGLLITKKYSSFIFLGELITNAPIGYILHDAERCEACGLCLSACPVGCDKTHCLSAVTQKKGELTEQERDMIRRHGSAWGCDICQKVCPHTLRAISEGTVYTNIDFFLNDRIPYLTKEKLEQLSDEAFSKRAYSWRGKEILLRNLDILDT